MGADSSSGDLSPGAARGRRSGELSDGDLREFAEIHDLAAPARGAFGPGKKANFLRDFQVLEPDLTGPELGVVGLWRQARSGGLALLAAAVAERGRKVRLLARLLPLLRGQGLHRQGVYPAF